VDPAHFRKQGQGIAGEKIRHGVVDGIIVGLFLEEHGRFADLLNPGGGLPHIARVHAHFMKEEVVEAIEVLHLPQAFGKIGAKQRPELSLIGGIDQLELPEAVENLGGGYPKPCGPAAGYELLNHLDHRSPVIE